jgi:hypothetical protein
MTRSTVVLTAIVIGVLLAAGGAIAAAPPAPTLTATPPNPSNQDTATFEFSDADATVFQCRLDSTSPADFSPCVSPKIYSGLADGSHTFDVLGVNADGPGPPATFSWTIDTQPPPAPSITARPPDPSNDSGPTFRFSDSEDGVTFKCGIDSSPLDECASPKTFTGLVSGRHTFRVRAFDQAGNESGATRYSWTVDLSPPPAPTITGSPPNPTSATSASFNFTDSEAGVTFSCALDGGDSSSCASPAAYSGLAQAAHVFSVRAVDTAGNIGAATSFGWSVIAGADTVAPGNVSGLKRSIGYGILKLVWTRPSDPDFDHVQVLIATARKGAKSVPKKVVYTGSETEYTDKRFRNNQYHLYRIFSYDHSGNQSPGVDVEVLPSALLLAPKDRAVVHAPPRLVWSGVAKARLYNIQLYFRGRKVLSAWPTHPRLGLKRKWSYSGRFFWLKKGAYTWFVWPGFGSRAHVRYGQLLGLSSFTVR